MNMCYRLSTTQTGVLIAAMFIIVRSCIMPHFALAEAAADARVASPDRLQAGSSVALPTEVSVDWQKAILTIHSNRPGEASAAAVFQLAEPPASLRREEPPPPIRVEGGELVFELTADDLPRYLVPETRTLWIRASVAASETYHRIDLPAPAIQGASTGTEGRRPRLTLRLADLLPGFHVLYATRDPLADHADMRRKSAESRVAIRELTFPRITEMAHRDGADHVTIEFDESDDARRIEHFVTVVNPDGSRSQTLRITREGDAFESRGVYAAEARPMPVDAWLRVPAVELLPLAEAVRRAEEAGLLPIPFDLHTLEELDRDGRDDALVLQQGLPPRTWHRKGEWLLLGTRDETHGYLAALDESLDLDIQAIESPLEVDDQLGLANMPQDASGLSGGIIGESEPGDAKSDIEDENGDPRIRVDSSEVEIRIPAGEPQVVESALPDRIRVPRELKDREAGDVVARLTGLGLKIDDDGKLFAKDRVTDTEPAEGTWVEPEFRIALRVERRVPDVIDHDAASAVAKLEDRELTPVVADESLRYRNGDRVIAQDPAAGEYVARNTNVTLTIHRVVPKVVGLRAAAAAELLEKRGFTPLGPKETLPTDFVAEQDPAAAELAAPGSSVKLTRIETVVPDLQGPSLAMAKNLTEAKRILDEQRIQANLLEPVTSYRGAKVLKQQPSAGTRIDRQKDQVELTLVIPVPRFTRSTRLDDALAQLQARSLEAVPHASRAKQDDFVLEVTVADQDARTYPSAGTTYVKAGEKLRLTVGRKVPSIAGKSWSEALRELKAADLDATTPLGSGTHVESTKPSGNALIDVNDKVVVYAGVKIPDVRGEPLDDARRTLDRLGLGATTASTSDVETPDRSLVGRRFVERSSRAQDPAQGRVVRKGEVRSVALRTIVYVPELVTVPQLAGLTLPEAERRLADRNLRIRHSTETRTTSDRNLAGKSTVVEQSPSAGRRIEPRSIVQVRLAQWEYTDPGLTTYALFPQRDHDSFGAVWTCRLSDDRKSITIETTNKNGQRVRGQGRLSDDRFVFQGKRCLTYEVDGLWETLVVSAIRIPFEGNGRGQIYCDSVWFYGDPGRDVLNFTTRPPRR